MAERSPNFYPGNDLIDKCVRVGQRPIISDWEWIGVTNELSGSVEILSVSFIPPCGNNKPDNSYHGLLYFYFIPLTTKHDYEILGLRGWTCYVSFHWVNWRHTDCPFLSSNSHPTTGLAYD